MKVEVLYFAGCPNHAPAVDLVLEVLKQTGTPAEMIEIEVADAASAQRLGFLGSPTIRVDGLDIEVAARSAGGFGLTCRTYVDGNHRAGLPPSEWVRSAIQESGRRLDR